MNRVGRKGYKIHIQVVGLLWDFRSKIKVKQAFFVCNKMFELKIYILF